MKNPLLATSPDNASLVARLALAATFFPHGAQHLLGWFGGYGFAGTHHWMTGTLGIPAPLAALAILVEFFAPLALLAGLGGRIAAFGLAAVMAVAATTHLHNGFFMNWVGQLPAGQEGFEYHLVVASLAAVVMIAGSGRWSMDRWLAGSPGAGA